MTDELEHPTQDDINQKLNDLLAKWHAWSQSYSLGKGYPSSDPIFGHSKSASHWDSRNGALDAVVDGKIMEAFDAVIWQVPRPHLTALQFLARNLASRAQVWTSPYLPKDEDERAVLLMEARNMLLRRLARSGVMS
jgi:hypothetical protein